MRKREKTAKLTIFVGLLALVVQGCTTGPTVTAGGKYLATTYGPGAGKRPWPHMGVDYRKPEGSAVLAPGDGEITGLSFGSKSINAMLCGKGVNIWHTGLAAKHMTRFCHMKRVDVKVGDRVRQGQVIGTVGRTGCRRANNCTPHLHFEVRYDYRLVDPATRIGGCYKEGKRTTDPNKPLVYPVRC